MAGLLGGDLGELGAIAGLLSGRQENWPMILAQLEMQKASKKRQEEMLQMQKETHGLNQEQARMQMEAQRRQMDMQNQLRDAAGQAFRPPQEAMGPVETGGPLMLPGGGGMPDFAQRAMAIDPLVGMQYQPKPRDPLAKIDPKDYTPESFRAFVQSGYQNPGVLEPYRKPQGPQVGQTREVKTGGKIHTYEWTGKEWKKIADAPMWKPDGDKAPKPQLYDGPNGPVWITPPGAGGGGAVPVTGPDGQPIPAKKREQALTETQSRGTLFLGQMRAAEEAIKALEGKIDPASLAGQANIAMANKGSTSSFGAPLNMLASKEAQQYNQAQEQWSEAFLRIKTGAASTKDEVIRNIRTFFPQPGDSAEVVAQKNHARAVATKQMEILANPQGVAQLDAQAGGASGGWGIREIK